MYPKKRGHAQTFLVVVLTLLLTISSANEFFVYKDQFGVTLQEKTDGTGMKNPAGVAVAPDGTILVLDSENHRLIKLTADLQYVSQFGVTGEAKTDATGFNKPRSLTVDASGNVFVSDTYNTRLVKLNANLQFVSQFGVTGQYLHDETGLNVPVGVDVDAAGNVFVADTNNHRVVKLTNDLQYVDQAGVTQGPRSDAMGFMNPVGVGVDTDGNVYVADRENHRIVKLDANLNFVTQFGIIGEARTDDLGLNKPHGVAVGPDGNVYVNDQVNQRVVILNPDLQYIGQFGVTGIPKADETGLNSPYGIDMDAEGHLLIADWHNQRLMRLEHPSNDWWDANLPNKRALTVTEKTGSDLRDVQVKVTLDTAAMVSAGKLRSDCGDLRFVDPVHGSLPYYIASGCNSASTTIWVRVPELKASASRQLTLRYGNPLWEGRSSFEQTMTAPKPDSSTVALWHLNEGVGSGVSDVSGKGNHVVPAEQRITIDESTNDWAFIEMGRPGDASLSLETSNIKEGSGAIKVAGGTSYSGDIAYHFGTLPLASWEVEGNRLGGTLQYWVYINDVSLSNPGTIEVMMQDNRYGIRHGTKPIAGDWVSGWNLVMLDLLTANYKDLGSIDWSAIDWTEFYASTNGASDNYFIFDDFKVTTAPSWTEGRFGNGLEYDGLKDNLRNPDSSRLPLGNSPRTITAWVKPVGYHETDYTGIITYGNNAKNEGSFLAMVDGGHLAYGFWENDMIQTTGATATLNEWNHVAFTYDGTTGKLYMNGELVTTKDFSGTTVSTSNGLIHLGAIGSPNRSFDGAIDEVAIFNRALSADEIRAYAEGRVYIAQEPEVRIGEETGPTPKLVVHLSFDDTGTTATDSAGDNDGTIIGDANRVDGIVGKGLAFDGNDYVDITSSALHDISESSYSWSAWYYPTSVPPDVTDHKNQAIICKQGYHVLMSYKSDSRFGSIIYMSDNTGVGAASAVLPPNNWYHLVQTVDDNAKSLKLYVNGELAQSTDYTGTLRDHGTNPVRIGACLDPGEPHDNLADGTVDEVRIYNYALDASAVQQQYDDEKPVSATPEPTADATVEPTAEATTGPTVGPTSEPTTEPTAQPTTEATVEPTAGATSEPTAQPTTAPIATPEPKGNGEACVANEDCASGNCKNKVCCLVGYDCCATNADCPPDMECSDRNYCQLPGATPVPEPSPTVTSAPIALPSAGPTISTAPSSTPLVTWEPPISSTPDPRKDNGQQCADNVECLSGNCAGSVCCLIGERCCDDNADCKEDEKCDTERFYCIAQDATPIPTEKPATEVSEDDAAAELARARALLDKARGNELDTQSVEAFLIEADRALKDGNTARAYKLAVDARAQAERTLATVKKDAGAPCTSNTECETGNCNRVCCAQGFICCTKDAHCMLDEHCDVERSVCLGEDEDGWGDVPPEEPGIIDELIRSREIIETGLFFAAGIGGLALFLSRRGGGKQVVVVQQQPQVQQPAQEVTWDASAQQQWSEDYQQQGWE